MRNVSTASRLPPDLGVRLVEGSSLDASIVETPSELLRFSLSYDTFMEEDDFGEIVEVVPLNIAPGVEYADGRSRPDLHLDSAAQERIRIHVSRLEAAQQDALRETQSLVIS
jgi:hypothetical protein